MIDIENIEHQTVTVMLFALNILWQARRVYQTHSSLKLPHLSGLL